MAFFGQTVRHSPQPMQASRLMVAFLSVRAAAPTGQTRAHSPQPMHFFCSTRKRTECCSRLPARGAQPMTRKLAEGVLATTDNQIDTSTGTVRLRASFDNADDKLFPNQFVNAVLTLTVLKNVILVPAAAVQRGPKGAAVFVVREGGTVESRPVTTGQTVGQDILVQSGLVAGETVVVDGSDRLRDGATVMARNPNGSAGK